MSKQSLECADAHLGFPIIDILGTKLADTGPQHRKEVGSAVTVRLVPKASQQERRL
jgi:hypothetical protein